MRGVFIIMATPYTESDAVDYEDLAREVDFLDRCGVQGMVWPQLASEYSRLTKEERLRGMEAIGKAAKGKKPALVLGVQGPNKAAALAYLEKAESVGPDAIIAIPPTEAKSLDDLPDLLYWFDGHRFHVVPRVGDIRAIAQTGEGDVWLGGYGGLYRWRSGVLSHFKLDVSPVKTIYPDPDGTLWIGVPLEERRGGLYRFREGNLDQIPGISGVLNILADRDGGFWVAASEGLFRVRGGKASLYEQNKNLPPQMLDLYQDSTGTLWFSTNGRGLFRFRDGRFQAITTKDGLPNNILNNAREDGKGNLWVTSNQGIFRLGLKELEPKFFVGLSDKTYPGVREWLVETCRQADFTPRILQDADREPAVIKFVAARMGVALLPQQIQMLPHEGVVFRPLKPTLITESCAVWRPDNRSNCLEHYVRIVKELSSSRR
jgi:hypothetical protein